jgi:hypothetical protein
MVGRLYVSTFALKVFRCLHLYPPTVPRAALPSHPSRSDVLPGHQSYFNPTHTGVCYCATHLDNG